MRRTTRSCTPRRSARATRLRPLARNARTSAALAAISGGRATSYSPGSGALGVGIASPSLMYQAMASSSASAASTSARARRGPMCGTTARLGTRRPPRPRYAAQAVPDRRISSDQAPICPPVTTNIVGHSCPRRQGAGLRWGRSPHDPFALSTPTLRRGVSKDPHNSVLGWDRHQHWGQSCVRPSIRAGEAPALLRVSGLRGPPSLNSYELWWDHSPIKSENCVG